MPDVALLVTGVAIILVALFVLAMEDARCIAAWVWIMGPLVAVACIGWFIASKLVEPYEHRAVVEVTDIISIKEGRMHQTCTLDSRTVNITAMAGRWFESPQVTASKPSKWTIGVYSVGGSDKWNFETYYPSIENPNKKENSR